VIFALPGPDFHGGPPSRRVSNQRCDRCVGWRLRALPPGVRCAGHDIQALAGPCRTGGSLQGPGGRAPPGDPTTPSPGAPTRGKPVTTPGSGIPSTTGGLPDIYWGTWWALNQWAYLPERGEALRSRRIATGEAGGPTPELLTSQRRALLARQVIKPFLLKMLAPEAKQRDTVRASAMLALAKVATDDATVELLMRTAEHPKATPLERESAALAVGLLRRSDKRARVDAITLDLTRSRLADLARNPKAPIRARCFACFSLGLLADQGYGSPFSREGRLVVRSLLEILASSQKDPDLPVAVMTALGMQPRAGIPSKIYEDLKRAVQGTHVYKRKWSYLERAHALSTYVRLRGPAWVTLALRALSDRRLPKPVQRAARLALGGNARDLTPDERIEAAKALIASEKKAPDHFSEGLGQIALARILNADMRADSTGVMDATTAETQLLQRASKSFVTVRGFHAMALALAARDVNSHHAKIVKFVKAAGDTLLTGYDKPKGDNDLRGAYAVGLGILRVQAARDRLVLALNERNSGPALRARAAIALAQMGALDDGVRDGLRAVIADTRALAPRSAAALALSLLTGVPESGALIRQLRESDSQRDQFRAAAALGQLDDPKALPAILEVARARKHNFEMRALAIAILGLLGDPEPTPSLFRLTLDANYIARTDALNEAFSLL